MPRSLSTALQNEVSSQSTQIAFLIKLNLSSTIRLTNYSSDIVYDSETYEAGGTFVQVESVTERGNLEVSDLQIGFSNVSDQVRALVQAGDFTDKKVEVYIAYLDSSNDLAGAINYFTGYVSSVAITDNLDQSQLSLNISSQFANWSLKKGRYFTDESQQQYSSGDVGLQYAAEVRPDIDWGKS